MAEAIWEVEVIDRSDCRAAAEERFSTERMVAAHVELFEQILSERMG
jgi:hypothetical protein